MTSHSELTRWRDEQTAEKHEYKALLLKINDLYQNAIQGLNADLEQGSHYWNNLMADEFNKNHKYFMEEFNALGKFIQDEIERRGYDY